MGEAPGEGGSDGDAVLVALGSNAGRGADGPARLLERALLRFSDHGLHVVKRSRWWRSSAWPDPADPPFLNGVARVETTLGPERVLAALHALEEEFGRVRDVRNAPRTLDLDLIAHGRTVMTGPGAAPGLVLPHPRAAERLFVMGPLAEIAPDWRHPATGAAAAGLAATAQVGRDARPLPSDAALHDGP